ncbi:hypothetical protein B0T20DRAFT_399867 [Sordaria brevicollis]|uniref:Uncharacterized protein n=1 Tax=Sordaria brevicollis TaxID=83679 RepID=A0AAE0PNC3_SORBR|nr:hypothetical protein B0T20DRAFT_399867 [Sordaria brevicollis]
MFKIASFPSFAAAFSTVSTGSLLSTFLLGATEGIAGYRAVSRCTESETAFSAVIATTSGCPRHIDMFLSTGRATKEGTSGNVSKRACWFDALFSSLSANKPYLGVPAAILWEQTDGFFDSALNVKKIIVVSITAPGSSLTSCNALSLNTTRYPHPISDPDYHQFEPAIGTSLRFDLRSHAGSLKRKGEPARATV